MDQADERTNLLAFDVGGANIKAADGLGWIHSERFELWRRPGELSAALARIVRLRCPDRVVATMTGEIADCYPSRQAGVERIVAALLSAAEASGRTVPLGIYLVDGSIVPTAEAIARPLAAAAANWHAMARLAAGHAATDRAIVIDAGSTTTDIVALHAGAAAPLAHDDAGRMAAGELVYTGVERTPLAAIVRSLPRVAADRSRRLQPIASERFADSRDAWLLLGGIPEEPLSRDTADGGPATCAAARVRLARMLLLDPGDFSAADARAAAEWCAEAQARIVARAVRRVAAAHGWLPTSIVVSGHGGCLARRAIARLGWDLTIVALPDKIGADVSRAAPAHALAMIARGLLP
jgi:probable H4MPT-linked C1 transfer pathway protein